MPPGSYRGSLISVNSRWAPGTKVKSGLHNQQEVQFAFNNRPNELSRILRKGSARCSAGVKGNGGVDILGSKPKLQQLHMCRTDAGLWCLWVTC